MNPPRPLRPLRSLIMALAAVLLVAAGARPVRTDAAEYTVTNLGTLPGGNASTAIAVNAAHQVGGYSRTEGGTRAHRQIIKYIFDNL